MALRFSLSAFSWSQCSKLLRLGWPIVARKYVFNRRKAEINYVQPWLMAPPAGTLSNARLKKCLLMRMPPVPSHFHLQNLITIPQGVSFPGMREIAHQNVYSASFFYSGFFLRATAETPEPIFTRNTSNDAVPRKDVPFRG